MTIKKKIIIEGKEYFAENVQDLYEQNFVLPQKMAEEFLRDKTVYSMNEEVEFILASDEQDKPFEFSDIENYDYTGQVEIQRRPNYTPHMGANNVTEWKTYTQEQADEKAEFWEYLSDKIVELQVVISDRIHEFDEQEKKGVSLTDKQLKYYNKLDAQEDRLLDTLNRCNENRDSLNQMYFDDAPEIMQWLLCPDLCYHLKQHGECVLDNKYWGRQCYGQSIILDSVIQNIAFDILSVEGA